MILICHTNNLSNILLNDCFLFLSSLLNCYFSLFLRNKKMKKQPGIYLPQGDSARLRELAFNKPNFKKLSLNILPKKIPLVICSSGIFIMQI